LLLLLLLALLGLPSDDAAMLVPLPVLLVQVHV
jgi:hypothetical protein